MADTAGDGMSLTIAEVLDELGDPVPLGVAHVLPSGATLTVSADGSFTYDADTSQTFNIESAGSTLDALTYTVINDLGVQSDAGTIEFDVDFNDDVHTVDDQVFAVSAAAADGDVVGRVLVDDVDQLAYTFSLPFIEPVDPTDTFRIDSLTGEIFVNNASQLGSGPHNLYVLVDHASVSVDADLTIHVLDNASPVAADQQYHTAEDVPASGNLITGNTGAGSSYDPDAGQTLSVVEINGRAVDVDQTITLGSGATLRIEPDGTFSFDPSTSNLYDELSAGDVETELVSFTLRDDYGADAVAYLSIDVAGRNDAPTAYGNDFATDHLTVFASNVLLDVGAPRRRRRPRSEGRSYCAVGRRRYGD